MSIGADVSAGRLYSIIPLPAATHAALLEAMDRRQPQRARRPRAAGLGAAARLQRQEGAQRRGPGGGGPVARAAVAHGVGHAAARLPARPRAAPAHGARPAALAADADHLARAGRGAGAGGLRAVHAGHADPDRLRHAGGDALARHVPEDPAGRDEAPQGALLVHRQRGSAARELAGRRARHGARGGRQHLARERRADGADDAARPALPAPRGAASRGRTARRRVRRRPHVR